jgi:hypothetical protein
MGLILGSVGALFLPFLMLLVLFAFSDNASDHDLRDLVPVRATRAESDDLRLAA